MVMAQSLFMTLKRLRPEAVLDVLAPEWTIPLLERMPEVKKAIRAPFAHGSFDLAGRRKLGRSLKQESYDQAIVLPNSFKSALVPWFAGIPRRTGWSGELRIGLLNDRRRLDKRALPRMIDRFNALAFDRGQVRSSKDFAESHPLPRLAVNRGLALETRRRFELRDHGPILALCPGAEFGAAKRWPEARYAELASARIAAGWQVWLFGSAKDVEVCERIRADIPTEKRGNSTSLAGRTSLAEAMDLLSLCESVVSNDSGLMHVAAALERPLVAVYGPTSPLFTPPLSASSRVVTLELACSPCFARECPLGHHNCLELLPASLVAEALGALEPAG